MKLCYLDVTGETGKFLFPNIDSRALNEILSYKSWDFFDSWSGSSEKINYLTFTNTNNGVLVETKDGIGFVSVLLNHLNKLGFTILDMKGKPFNQYDGCIKVKYPQFRFALRNYQSNCCLKWLRDGLGIIKAPTGSGKTVMAAYLIKNLGYKTLILIHEKSLIIQWKEKLIEIFGQSMTNRISIFSGDKGNEIDKAIKKQIVIGTYQTALKRNNIDKLRKAGFGFLVTDETHYVAAETFKKVVNGLFIPYKLGISATPKRLDGKESEIYALVDSIKADIPVRSLIKDGFVVEPKFYNIYWIDSEINRTIARIPNGLQKSINLKQLSANSYKKYSLLIKLINKFVVENKTFLLYADYVKASENIDIIINEMITKKNKKFKVSRVTQKMIAEERFALYKQLGKKYSGLIFSKIGSEGIDIPGVDCVVMLNPSKSIRSFSQRTGRGMRPAKNKTHCEIYQFVLRNSMEESWKDYSFNEYMQADFIQKNYYIG